MKRKKRFPLRRENLMEKKTASILDRAERVIRKRASTLKHKAGRERKRNSALSLSREELEARCRKNLKRIALLGLLLALADLGVSFLDQDVSIRSDSAGYYMTRPDPGHGPGHIDLVAVVKGQEDSYERKIAISLQPRSTESESVSAPRDQTTQVSEAESIRNEFRRITSAFNEDLSSRKVYLPQSLSGGERIQWSTDPAGNTVLLLLLTALSMLMVYRGRLRPMQRLELARKQSVLRHLPDFIGELVLLMNAGLVLSRAFEMVAEHSLSPQDERNHGAPSWDAEKQSSRLWDEGGQGASAQRDDDYFLANIRRIYDSVKHMNGSFHRDLYRFARESGVSEFLRISATISDNINKGVELTRKLERESESLWIDRKLRAQQRGLQAETKMTIPLAIFLCALIVITIAPALLQL